MARADKQTNIRLPDQLKEWLLERAGDNRRSLTSEVVMRLEQSRKAEIEASQKGEAGK
ncbi:Arc family DNA-binding protein [Xenophilus sp.]|uniref:Arc family DNA-binding protein n=1 Tax=Xenophilus sp. TaxID=1873499 RepID=UPI0037DD6355